MYLTIRKANIGDIPVIARLAEEIWNEYYPPIIGQKQVDYMLGEMYSENALHEDFEEGVTFLIAEFNEEAIGFAAFQKVKKGTCFLHKLYVSDQARGTGAGWRLLQEVEKESENTCRYLKLQVNRFNIQAINFYFRQGFIIEKHMDKPIGEGFIMEDYMMLKPLKTAF